MADSIGPGSELLCVKSSPEKSFPQPVIGNTYTCDEVVNQRRGIPCPYDGCGTVGFVIRGLSEMPHGYRVLYCPNFFVPAGRRGAFDHLLVTEDVRELEDA